MADGAGFDPLQLTSEASLNRTRIAALRGAERRWIGRPAFDLLSRAALERLARATGTARPERVAVIFGRRLGHLVATLLTEHAAAPGESAWREAYLRHWRQVEHVWLGGGLAAALGQALLAATRTEAARLGADAVTIDVAPQPAVLALVGLARTFGVANGRGVVLDFGHTLVKRGVAEICANDLRGLHAMPEVTTRDNEVVEFVIDTVAETVSAAREQFGALLPSVKVSLASYMANGRPVDSHSTYSPLGALEPREIAAEITARCGAALDIEFFHDGTIAARGLPHSPHAALIMLGTGLGVGFPPSGATRA